MAILIEDQLPSGPSDKQLKHSYLQATISLMPPEGNCYIRVREPQTLPKLVLREARVGILWSGREPIPLREVHRNSWAEEKSLRLR